MLCELPILLEEASVAEDRSHTTDGYEHKNARGWSTRVSPFVVPLLILQNIGQKARAFKWGMNGPPSVSDSRRGARLVDRTSALCQPNRVGGFRDTSFSRVQALAYWDAVRSAGG